MKIMSKIKAKWYQNQVDSLQATLEKEEKALQQAYHIQIQDLEKKLQQQKEQLWRRYMKLRGALEVKLKKNEKLLPRLIKDWSIVTDQAVKYEIEIKTKQANDDIPKFKKQLALLENALDGIGYQTIEDEEINEDEDIKSIQDDIELTKSDLQKLKNALEGKGDDQTVENEKNKNLANELNLLKSALATGDDSKIPEQYKPKSDKKTPARENQEILLKNVKDAWIEGVLKQSLHNEVLIELRKTQDTDAVDRFQQPLHLTQETEGAGQVLLEDDIQEVYEKGGRTLLILGAPGAGKTISLLELTQRLAEDAAFDASQPIPVVFNLSSWAEKKQPLQDWLVDELWNKYRISKNAGRKWIEDVENQPLVLLLDGLDEVAAGQRAACVQAINVYRQEYGLGGIVVACRVEEYNALAEKLKLEQALCVQPLTEEQVGNYLAAGGEELAGLRTALPADAALQELASSPLMLSMMCLAYKGKSPEVILQDVVGNAETRQHNLFSAYVRRMFQRPRSGVHYEEEKTRRWLTFLAHNMQKHGQTIFQIENLQPSWLLTKGGIWNYIAISRYLFIILMTATIVLLIMKFGGIFFLSFIRFFLRYFIEAKNFMDEGAIHVLIKIIKDPDDVIMEIFDDIIYSKICLYSVSICILIYTIFVILNWIDFAYNVNCRKYYIYFALIAVLSCLLLIYFVSDSIFYLYSLVFTITVVFILFSCVRKKNICNDIQPVCNIYFLWLRFFGIILVGGVFIFLFFIEIDTPYLVLYNRANNRESVLRQQKEPVGDVVFSPAGTMFVTKNANNDKLTLWTQYGEKIKEIKVDSLIQELKFSPDGSRFATKDYLNEWIIWMKNGDDKKIVVDDIDRLEFSPKGNFIITNNKINNKTILDKDGGVVMENIEDVRFCSDDSLFAVKNNNNDNWILLTKEKIIVADNIKNVAFSKDSSAFSTQNFDNKWTIWTLNGEKIKFIDISMQKLEFNIDGSIFVARDYKNKLTVFVKNGDILKKFDKNITDILLSKNAFITKDLNDKSIIWMQDGNLSQEISDRIAVAAFSFDDTRIVTIDNKYKGTLWIRDGNKIRQKKLSGLMRAIEFSMDSTVFVSHDIEELIGGEAAGGKSTLWNRDGEKISDIFYKHFSDRNYEFFSSGEIVVIRKNFDEYIVLKKGDKIGGFKRDEEDKGDLNIYFMHKNNFFIAKSSFFYTRKENGDKIKKYKYTKDFIVSFSHDGNIIVISSKKYNIGQTVTFLLILITMTIAFIISFRVSYTRIEYLKANKEIFVTFKNSLLLGSAVGVSIGIILVLTEWMFDLLPLSELFSVFILGIIMFGVPVTMRFGLMDFLKHFNLRFVLWLYGYAPWNYARFLDHATDRLFLRKVGGGYIFVHRLLLEYFAADETQLNLLLKKKNAAKAKA